MDTRWLQVLFLALMCTHGKTGELWKPEHSTRDEFMRCKGVPCVQYAKMRRKLQQLKVSVVDDTMPSADMARMALDMQNMNETGPTTSTDLIDDCMLLTEEQIDALLAYNRQRGDLRHRRSLVEGVFRRWSLPIRWKFDGEHTERERTIIRNAFQHWMDQTCVRFEELITNEKYNDNHIIVTRNDGGCYSFIGKVNVIPQVINLRTSCLEEFGTPVHEIGHALGFWHEQQRPDRDDFIRILWNNLNYYKSQFIMRPINADFQLQYDVDSVMHYGPTSGSKDGVSNTMETRNPLYQHNMGQRVGLSFLNAKVINYAYCNHTCVTRLAFSCQRLGYQDPNNCFQCKCPDGFSGTYCEDVEPSVNAECGGVVTATYTPQTITTPGYDDLKYYGDRPECSWLIKASPNDRVVMTFEGEFGVYAHSHQRCFHWVEVRHSKELGMPGPRFCGYKLPNVTFKSDTNELMVVFRTNWTVPWPTAKRGFKARLVAVPSDGRPLPRNVPTNPRPKTPTTTTATPRLVESIAKSCGKLDFTFALDSSGSIKKDGWRKLCDFVKKVLSELTVNPDHVRVSVISFGNEATLHFGLSDHANLEGTLAAVDAIPWKDQWTNTSGAMRVMTKKVFQPQYGDRSDAPNVCLVITDGPSNRDEARTVPDAITARKAGIKIFAAGVGMDVNQVELGAITGRADRITYVWDFDVLKSEKTVDTILRKICQSVSQTAIAGNAHNETETMLSAGISGAPWLHDQKPLLYLGLLTLLVALRF